MPAPAPSSSMPASCEAPAKITTDDEMINHGSTPLVARAAPIAMPNGMYARMMSPASRNPCRDAARVRSRSVGNGVVTGPSHPRDVVPGHHAVDQFAHGRLRGRIGVLHL